MESLLAFFPLVFKLLILLGNSARGENSSQELFSRFPYRVESVKNSDGKPVTKRIVDELAASFSLYKIP